MTARTSELIGKPGRKHVRKPVRGRKHARPLTDSQRKFVERFLVHWNATRAYREAYPAASERTAATNASDLLRHAEVAPIIKRAQAEVRRRYMPSKNNALQELAALGFSNVQDFYTPEGALIPLSELPRHVSAAVKKVKSKEITAIDLTTGEEKVVGHERELELHDKVAALRLVGQHVGLFEAPLELHLGRDFGELLREARARAGLPAPIEGKAKRVEE
jgi:phage terminase small subunit